MTDEYVFTTYYQSYIFWVWGRHSASKSAEETRSPGHVLAKGTEDWLDPLASFSCLLRIKQKEKKENSRHTAIFGHRRTT